MTSRQPFAALLIVLPVVAATCGPLVAQAPSSTRTQLRPSQRSFVRPYGRPTYSPYLNLLRGGDPVFNYYGLVRPELQFRATEQQLHESFGEFRSQLDSMEQREGASNLRATGHRSRFLVDLRGGPTSPRSAVSTREQRMQSLPAAPSSRLPPTGHSVYFGNSGTYYSNR